MGNSQSSQGTIPLSNILNYVSANYILTSKFQDMKKLSQHEYCNDIVVLTSKIISNNLSNLEVEYLAQRLKGNKTVNYMNKENVAYLPKEQILQLDIRNKTQKKRICNGIAKFYVKVAHVYAAILTTLNPTTESNQTQGKKDNMCGKRISALENNNARLAYGIVKVFPSFCNMNKDQRSGNATLLDHEPGIRELEKLYYDKYDYNTGEFIGMTKETRKQYERDVCFFYKAFTGQECPSHIKFFSQVPLTDYSKHRLCDTRVSNSGATNANGPDTDGDTSATQATKLKERLLKKYAVHIRNMMKSTESKRNQLVGAIDKMFVFGIHPHTGKKEIMVNPSLTMKGLDDISIKTRDQIKELYADCEKNFTKGLDIFEAIVQTQIMQTSKKQIRVLERKRNNIRSTLYDKPTEKREPSNYIARYRGAPGSPLPYTYRNDVRNDIARYRGAPGSPLPYTYRNNRRFLD